MQPANGKGLTHSANGKEVPDDVIFGSSEAMRQIRYTVERASKVSVPVLILGESGTGKEIIAQQIHLRSPWSGGSFVKVSCPAIPGTLIESELFGYEKGAFTGAWNSKPGRVELAHRGTLFLDEIGEMDLSLQAKLLQLLQDGQFSRIGGKYDTSVEVRIVCATNRQLEEEIETGEFRQDLFYRINVVNVTLPPLRQRREDIPQLANFFLNTYNRQHGQESRPISSSVMQLLCEHDWPGNIRELENLLRRYVIMGSEDGLVRHLTVRRRVRRPLPEEGSATAMPLKEYTRRAVGELERDIILKVLEQNHWNRKRAAEVLQISYRALLYKIKKAGLPSKNSVQPLGVGD